MWRQFSMSFLGRDVHKTAKSNFTKSSKKMANGLQQKRYKVLVSELFRGGREGGSKVSLCPASRNQACMLNAFTYRKRKLYDFGQIISLDQTLKPWISVNEWPRSCGAFVLISDSGNCLTEKGWVCFFCYVALLYNTPLTKASLTAMVYRQKAAKVC